MAQIIAYLNFNGNCREAMNFYKDAFGGELHIMTVGETPVAAQMPDKKDQVMHARLVNSSLVLMGSDMASKNLVNENAVSLVVNCDSTGQANTFAEKLSAGGKLKMPVQKTFWAEAYGEAVDPYGYLWSINYETVKS